MLRRATVRLWLAAAFIVTVVGPSYAATLWYNGDLDGTSGLANLVYVGTGGVARVYDDFIVPAGGWNVSSIWSNNALWFTDVFTAVNQAAWEIRSGVSAGNGGALVSGGIDTATQAATGHNLLGMADEYRIEVSGLNLNLAPGRYWLNVTPYVPVDMFSYVTTTTGANAVGSPAGNNDNAFIDSNMFGLSFVPVEIAMESQLVQDFSMGVGGTAGGGVVPEPATMALLSSGLLGIAVLRRKKL